MTPAELPVSPPDIAAILTSLGVFSLAIAAVVGGIYKGIKEVRRENEDTRPQGRSGGSSESTDQLTEAIRAATRQSVLLTEALQDHRNIVRSQIEDQHRLRAAIVDLVDVVRRR